MDSVTGGGGARRREPSLSLKNAPDSRQNGLPDRKASQSKRKSAGPSVLPKKTPRSPGRLVGVPSLRRRRAPGAGTAALPAPDPSTERADSSRCPSADQLHVPLRTDGSPPHGRRRRKFSKPSFPVRSSDALPAHGEAPHHGSAGAWRSGGPSPRALQCPAVLPLFHFPFLASFLPDR